MKTKNNNIKTNNILKMLLITIMLITAVPVIAQEDELTPFDENVQDVNEPTAPINGFIHLGIAIGLIAGYKALEKKKQLL